MSTTSTCQQSARATMLIPVPTLLSRIIHAPNPPHIVSWLLSYPEHPTVHFAFTRANLLQLAQFNPHSQPEVYPGAPLDSPSHFPVAIQDKFLDYNLQLHVAWVFYVLSLVWTSLAMLFGLTAFFYGAIGTFMIIFTSVRIPNIPTPFSTFS